MTAGLLDFAFAAMHISESELLVGVKNMCTRFISRLIAVLKPEKSIEFVRAKAFEKHPIASVIVVPRTHPNFTSR
jgi:hypothetical protein